VIKHTIITKKPKIELPKQTVVIPSNTATIHYPVVAHRNTIQAAIDSAREGYILHTKPKVVVTKKINNQQEFNDYLNDIKVTQGEYATFNASKKVHTHFQIYYIHYVEVDYNKVTLFNQNGEPCPVHVIQCHELHGDKSPYEWHTGTKLRPLSQDEKENILSDTVRNRIQDRIRILQSAESRTSGC
jgi:hypothetical protein